MSYVLAILAGVVGWYVWLVYGTAFIFPTDLMLFRTLLVVPIAVLLIAAAFARWLRC